jgi:protocatechuate 3,4-dioxygenase beta subunit
MTPERRANEVDRRSLLRGGGLLTVGAVLAACGGGRTGAPSVAPSSVAGAAPSAAAGAAPPSRSPVDLLEGANTCTLTPATIAGPTWFDAHAVRSDIRDDRPGTPLDLAFRVVRARGCTPLPAAVVDLWQCDALGVYSGFARAAPGQGGDPDGTDEYGDRQAAATDRERFLRGTQVTGPDGVVGFATVYPGWYPTRTPHLHVKVHLGRTTVLTTQLFFDDAVTDAVHAGDPYRQHGPRDTRNGTDAFYSPAAQLRLATDGGRRLGAVVLAVP